MFLIAILLAMAQIAPAKPYEIDPGPMPEGDPTADDQPSPTPKKRSARFGGESTITPDAGPTSATRRGFLSWDLYLRILSRLTLR